MRTVRFREHGGPEVIEVADVPDLRAGPGQVVMEVRAISLNHLDLWMRRGLPGMKVSFPHVPGSDAAGVVREVGPGVSRVKPGDRVVFYPVAGCGRCPWCLAGEVNACEEMRIAGEQAPGFASELALAQEEDALAIPEGLSFEEASVAPVAYLTAWRMLAERAALRAGEWVLVLGAASGVGVAAVQMAKCLGAQVIAAAGSEKKLEKARELGADHLIDYRKEPLPRRARQLTGGRGVDVVFEHVGQAVWEGCLKSLARMGRLVTCGATSGPSGPTPIPLVFFKHLSILGSTMGSRRQLAEVLELMGRGAVKAVIGRTLPLAETRRAHELLEARGVVGKLVLVP
ncbi:MAG: zinc-binding dehydrogenase [Nitrospinota bacterium]